MEQNNNQQFSEYCHLRLYRRTVEARELILKEARISPEERETIPSGEMKKHIWENHATPQVKMMFWLDDVFSLVNHVLDVNRPKDPYDKQYAVESLAKIIPYTFPADQIFFKEIQARCYRYVDLTDDEKDHADRYQLYREVIEKYPFQEGKGDKDLMLWAREIDELNVSVFDKYEAIKKAQRRSSDYGRYAYKDMLAPLAKDYFSLKINMAKNSNISYTDKLSSAKDAQKVIEDIELSDEILSKYRDDPLKLQEIRDTQKHKYKLEALSCLKSVYKKQGREKDADAVALQIGKEQNVFYKKYPHLRVNRRSRSLNVFQSIKSPLQNVCGGGRI